MTVQSDAYSIRSKKKLEHYLVQYGGLVSVNSLADPSALAKPSLLHIHSLCEHSTKTWKQIRKY
jgi:hypothetical protein